MTSKVASSKITIPRQNSILWFGFFIVLPLIYCPWFQDQDQDPKLLIISISTLVLLSYSLFRKEKQKLNSPSKLFFIAALLFLGCTLVSSGRIINNEEGISTFIYLLIPFLFLYSILISGELNLKSILKPVPYSIFIISAITLLEIFIKSDFSRGLTISYAIRATLSNKNFISETLVMLLPFSLIGITKETGRVRKINIAAAIVCLIMILILKTISAWIAVGVTAMIVLPVYYKLFPDFRSFFFYKYPKKKIFTGIFILIALAGASTYILNKNNFFYPIKLKTQLALKYYHSNKLNMIDKDDEANVNSVFQRMLLWRNSYYLTKENSMTGIGLSNWKIMWPKYGVGGAYYLSAGVMHFEHPHNEFILFLTETGIIGLVAFLIIFIFPIGYGLKYSLKKSNENRSTVLILTGGIFSFLILSFFGYPFHRPFACVLLMVMIGVMFSIQNSNGRAQAVPSKFIIIACLLISLFCFRVVIARTDSDIHMHYALEDQFKGHFARMLKELNAAENSYSILDNTATPLNWYKGFAHFYSGSDSSLYYFIKAEKQNPFHLQVLSDIGASLENKGRHEEAISYLNRAVQITPGFSQAHMNLAVAYYNMKKLKPALAEINSRPVESEYYDKVLSAILESYLGEINDSTADPFLKECFQKNYSDISTLKRLNKLSRKNNIALEILLKDSCQKN